ncbi:hypothetical protein VTK56DRAFT_7899 [Thermocarpiscus australiensis]
MFVAREMSILLSSGLLGFQVRHQCSASSRRILPTYPRNLAVSVLQHTVRSEFTARYVDESAIGFEVSSNYGASGRKPNIRQPLSKEEWSVLQSLFRERPKGGSPEWTGTATTSATAGLAAHLSPSAPISATVSNSSPPESQQAAHEQKFTRSSKHPLSVLAYLHQLGKEGRKAQEAGDMSVAAIAQLPATAFSELLRSLDPVDSCSKEADPTDDIRVGPGMARLTPMGREFDVWGVRKRYVMLLTLVMAACKLRIQAGRPLLHSDYKILLRCAGAACDLESVETAWNMTAASGVQARHPDIWYELIKAQLLTEPLYTQYDLARSLVSPINLHMKKLWLLARKKRHYLRILRHNRLRRQLHYFGFDRRTLTHAQPIARILRQHHPPLTMYRKVTKPCYIVDERVLCALMVAMARSGSMRMFEDLILKRFWRIQVQRRPGFETMVNMRPVVFAPDSPLRPSNRLLDALVTSYCVNGELAAALKVLHCASRCYAIQISDQLWFDLLKWAYILRAKPVVTEWKIVNRQFRGSKVISRNAVQMV